MRVLGTTWRTNSRTKPGKSHILGRRSFLGWSLCLFPSLLRVILGRGEDNQGMVIAGRVSMSGMLGRYQKC